MTRATVVESSRRVAVCILLEVLHNFVTGPKPIGVDLIELQKLKVGQIPAYAT